MRQLIHILFLSFLLPAIFCGCTGVPIHQGLAGTAADSTPKDAVEQLRALENIAANREEVPLGTLLGTIRFEVSAGKTTNEEDGIIPWISLEASEKEVAGLIDKNETVIPYTSVTLLIDYPLTYPYRIPLNNGKGFTRLELLKAIMLAYGKVYTEEEATANTKTVPLEKRTGISNRNKTDGKYGIWGHDLSDLVLSEIYVYQSSAGDYIVTLGIES